MLLHARISCCIERKKKMEQIRYANLPIVGRVQHGERVDNGKGTIRTKELGYFIAKIQDDFMQMYLDKFNELFTLLLSVTCRAALTATASTRSANIRHICCIIVCRFNQTYSL